MVRLWSGKMGSKSSAIHSVHKNKHKPSNFSEGNLVTLLTKRKAEKSTKTAGKILSLWCSDSLVTSPL